MKKAKIHKAKLTPEISAALIAGETVEIVPGASGTRIVFEGYDSCGNVCYSRRPR